MSDQPLGPQKRSDIPGIPAISTGNQAPAVLMPAFVPTRYNKYPSVSCEWNKRYIYGQEGEILKCNQTMTVETMGTWRKVL